MDRLVYTGPSAKDDISEEFHVRDEDGKMHRLTKGQVSDSLPDSLRAELLEGSDRTKGHKFTEPTDEQLEAAGVEPGEEKPKARSTTSSGDAGGSGGTTTAPGSGSSTGTTPPTA